MKWKLKNIRSFIGAKDFEVSKSFYQDLGYEAKKISDDLWLLKLDDLNAFYLQKAYVKDWVDNTMMFLQVENIEALWGHYTSLNLSAKHKGARLSQVRSFEHGRQFFLHDPSGILWHYCKLD